MNEKILLEFFPEIILEIPESPGGSCCLKPMVSQSKNSKKMYILAQHLEWKFRNRLNLVIPTKSESRIMLIKKYIQFKADMRKRRLGINRIPALVLNGMVLCEGSVPTEAELENIVKKYLNKI